MTPEIKINGVVVQTGSTVNVTVGTKVDYVVNFTNNTGQTAHTAVAAVRDDGAERLETCGASGSGGGGGGFGSGASIFANDPVYTRGHTVRLMLLGALGPNTGPTGPGQCLLGAINGTLTRANVQAERLLVALVVQ